MDPHEVGEKPLSGEAGIVDLGGGEDLSGVEVQRSLEGQRPNNVRR